METTVPTWLAEWLANPSPALIALVPLLAFLEAAALIGIFVSGIFLLTTATLLYTSGTTPIEIIVPLAFLGAFCGDMSGYLLGRYFGPEFWKLPMIRRYADRRTRIEDLMRRSAPIALVVGRLTPAIRSITPIVAGMSGMSVRTYLACDTLACTLWASGLFALVTGISFLAG